MPQSENVQCGVDVAVENRAALTAHPFSNPKTLSAFRTAHRAAVGTGLGCEAFRHFTVHHLPRYRFVFKKVAEDRPSGVIDGFSHLRFGQFGAGNSADHDQFTGFRQPVSGFMQKVLTPVSDPGMEIPCLAGTALTLMFSKLLLLVAIPARRFDLRAIGTGGERFQAQINAKVLLARSCRFFWCLTNEVDVPTSPRILGEVATFDRVGKVTTVPEPETVTGIADGILQNLNARGFEGNPAQRPLTAPAQSPFLLLLTAVGVFLADGLHRLRVQAQFLAAARGQFVQIKAAGPALIPAQGVLLGFVTEVPDDIDRTGHSPQSVGTSRVFNSVAKGFNHLFIILFPHRSSQRKNRRTPFAVLSIPFLKEGVFRTSLDNRVSRLRPAQGVVDDAGANQIARASAIRIPSLAFPPPIFCAVSKLSASK